MVSESSVPVEDSVSESFDDGLSDVDSGEESDVGETAFDFGATGTAPSVEEMEMFVLASTYAELDERSTAAGTGVVEGEPVWSTSSHMV